MAAIHARRRLDERLLPLRGAALDAVPQRGWVRAIREALGMSTTELAARMDVSQQSVSDLEKSEVRGTIKLVTLRRAAEALDCDLVYALVPRQGLDEAVRAQAHRQALRHVVQVAHHSRLEDQAVDDDAARVQVDELAQRLVDRRGLWTEQRST
jgi:predicted DNA-binding mobile mystery protein A